MQKIVIVAIIVLILITAGVVFFVISSPQEPEQPDQTEEPNGNTQPLTGVDRSFYEGLSERHPQGELFVQEVLKALDELEDEDETNDLNAFLAMGSNLNLLEEKEEALQWYEKAFLLDSTSLIALNNTANIYSDLGRYEESETAWLTLLEVYPDRVPAYRSLGYLYRFRLLKSSEEIEAFFVKGFEATNNHPDLFNWLISYFLETGNNEKFVEYANLLNANSKSQ